MVIQWEGWWKRVERRKGKKTKIQRVDKLNAGNK
jgi:hypothetical protein